MANENTKPDQPILEPILERIKTAVHSAADIARSLQVEHETAERIHRLLVIRHAALVELSEMTSQAVIDSSDSVNASATQISNQAASMIRMEKFADKQADAQQIAQTQDVLFADDVASILHVLRIMKRSRITEAARQMRRAEVAEIIDALLKAVE